MNSFLSFLISRNNMICNILFYFQDRQIQCSCIQALQESVSMRVSRIFQQRVQLCESNFSKFFPSFPCTEQSSEHMASFLFSCLCRFFSSSSQENGWCFPRLCPSDEQRSY